MKKRLYLIYPGDLVNKPIIWEFIKSFDVVVNIKSASMKGEVGLVTLELEGDKDEIERGINWFESKGIKVERIEQDVIEP
ncbi:MAG: NIL domain-containing protein [Candidatus Calescibacterium sp.]|jgi:ABC-type methionine transport system ATPase subunit|nr:NIL domain-containing protein [Candidatus Calescibacterium sp.]